MPTTSSRTIIGTPSIERTPHICMIERTVRRSSWALRTNTGARVARTSCVTRSATVPQISRRTRSSAPSPDGSITWPRYRPVSECLR